MYSTSMQVLTFITFYRKEEWMSRKIKAELFDKMTVTEYNEQCSY
ncbi:hypothetical protein CLOSTHATH_05844 [Hungatella hathewayi DSM 13479]|uniref:Uncharacterized protein n=1 Tax=Hungatella hathewayi DSM 13479 TaxID=566550 RepID=D3AQD7_9FIRM|nr:hypothetical protein CLOSTHATH_05844 [Hungatella hathewayi DSM 13479]